MIDNKAQSKILVRHAIIIVSSLGCKLRWVLSVYKSGYLNKLNKKPLNYYGKTREEN